MPSKFSIIGELWEFMKVRKKWWAGAHFHNFDLTGLLIVMTQGSAAAPLYLRSLLNRKRIVYTM